MSFDIAEQSGFDFEQISTLEVLDPITAQPNGLVIQVRSYRSEAAKRVARRIGNASILAKTKNPKKAGTIEETEERAYELVAAAIFSWNMKSGGKDVPATPEAIIPIISQPRYFFISEQVDERANDDARFLMPSQAS